MIPHVRSPCIMHRPLASPVSRETAVIRLACTANFARTGVTRTDRCRTRGKALIGTPSYPLPPA